MTTLKYNRIKEIFNPTQHQSQIQINNTIERFNRERKRKAKTIDTFPNVQSVLMLKCARLRHVAEHNGEPVVT